MSSSEQESVHTFHSVDLRLVSILAPFEFIIHQSSQFDSSLIDSDSDFVFRVPSTPTSVLPSPLKIPADLRSDFSHVALASQTSEESDIPASDVSVPEKMRVHKINRGRFQKEQNVKRKDLTTSATHNRLPPIRPKSDLFQCVSSHSPTSDTILNS